MQEFAHSGACLHVDEAIFNSEQGKAGFAPVAQAWGRVQRPGGRVHLPVQKHGCAQMDASSAWKCHTANASPPLLEQWYKMGEGCKGTTGRGQVL